MDREREREREIKIPIRNTTGEREKRMSQKRALASFFVARHWPLAMSCPSSTCEPGKTVNCPHPLLGVSLKD